MVTTPKKYVVKVSLRFENLVYHDNRCTSPSPRETFLFLLNCVSAAGGTLDMKGCSSEILNETPTEDQSWHGPRFFDH